jgi:hypothetical protein
MTRAAIMHVKMARTIGSTRAGERLTEQWRKIRDPAVSRGTPRSDLGRDGAEHFNQRKKETDLVRPPLSSQQW